MVAGREPEIEREEARFDGEGGAEQGPGEGELGRVLVGRGEEREVGHVEGAQHAVEQAHPGKEEERGEEVERHVFEPPLELLAPPAQHDEGEGGNEEDLKSDEEVEDVGRKEGRADPEDHDMNKSVVAAEGGLPVHIGEGEDGGAEADQGGDQNHERSEAIGRIRDGEGRGPIAEVVNQNRSPGRGREQADGPEEEHQ